MRKSLSLYKGCSATSVFTTFEVLHRFDDQFQIKKSKKERLEKDPSKDFHDPFQ